MKLFSIFGKKQRFYQISLMALVSVTFVSLLAACGDKAEVIKPAAPATPNNTPTIAATTTSTPVPTTVAPTSTPAPTATPTAVPATPIPLFPTTSPTTNQPTPMPTSKYSVDDLKKLGFKEFTSEAGKFSMLLPAEVKTDASSVVINTNEGTLGETYTAVQRDDQLLIFINYLDYPEDYVNQNGAEKILKAQREKLEQTQGVQFKSERDIKFDERYPGKEYQYGVQAWGLFFQRIYLVNNRLYSMAAVGVSGITPLYTLKLFDSFKLTK
jgi:hypothetical protein